ncbi:MAG TPA: WYL domain-containing protein [Flavobacterium sp.]|nr:WYL domain-containing protein [Flavobacterium sp.]
MSKSNRNYVKRQVKIINYLKIKPLVYEEIYRKLENSLDDFSGYSLRTFQRDLKTIGSLFSIDIKFNRAIQKYEITNEESDLSHHRLFESIELADVLSKESKSALLLDTRKAKAGSERFEEVLEAIEARCKMKMNYKKYGEQNEKFRYVYPLVIKEARSRWYLIAMDETDLKIKSFAFDRITALSVTNESFQMKAIALNTYFNDFFGVDRRLLTSENKVVLETQDENQMYYLESLPLHSSQRIEKISEKKYRIYLGVHITYDFILELMALSSAVYVVEPLFLVEKMQEQLEKAMTHYRT